MGNCFYGIEVPATLDISDDIAQLPAIQDHVPPETTHETLQLNVIREQTLYVLVAKNKHTDALFRDYKNRLVIYIGESEVPDDRLKQEQNVSIGNRSMPLYIRHMMTNYEEILFVRFIYLGKFDTKQQSTHLEQYLQKKTCRQEESAEFGKPGGFTDFSWNCDVTKLLEILLPTMESFQQANPLLKIHLQSCHSEATQLLKESQPALWNTWVERHRVILDYGDKCELPRHYKVKTVHVNMLSGGVRDKKKKRTEEGKEEEISTESLSLDGIGRVHRRTWI